MRVGGEGLRGEGGDEGVRRGGGEKMDGMLKNKIDKKISRC